MDLYITQCENKIYYYSLNEFGHIYDLYPEEMLTDAVNGNLYMGVVKDRKNAMNAAFVNIGEENLALLAYEDMTREASSGESILVQAIRGSDGSKGAKLTMKFSLEGNSCVLLTDSKQIRFSHRLTPKQKEEIKEQLKNKSFHFGFIIRSGVSDTEKLFREMRMLEEKATNFIERAQFLKGPCPILVKNPLDILIGRKDIQDIYTNVRDIFEKTVAYVEQKELMYSVHFREENYFVQHDIAKALVEATQKKIWLKSGGYLLLDKTEAMYVIDVNTGKTKGASGFEKTAYKTNLEAAKEVARQMRLRNLSGIILVDFIDMKAAKHQQDLLDKMREYTGKDAMAVTVHGLTKLGIMEITRKKKFLPLNSYLPKVSDSVSGAIIL